MKMNANTAYVIGIALGDGNLSNPNNRAVRLRVTCDKKYPLLIERIKKALSILFPNNRVGVVNRKTCVDVSVYSNTLEQILGWKASCGSKERQSVRVPSWIFTKKVYIKRCLKGLFETDGSVYFDRGYIYANFTNIIPELIKDTSELIDKLGFTHHIQKSTQKNGKIKYVVRVSKNVRKFIKCVNIDKQ